MYEHLCVARQAEMDRLVHILDKSIAGQGQVCFISGEAGAGKSTLAIEFAHRAEKLHKDLITTIGICNAQSGLGDPYLPFREVLELLTGDVDKRLNDGSISPENARRIQKFFARSVQTIIDIGPDLVDVLIPGGGLLVKLGKSVADRTGMLDKLEALSIAKKGLPGLSELTMDQNHVFEQFSKVLKALAVERPLLILLDDLHWGDASSISLLFHLGRSIGHSRIMIVGTYRPEEVARGRQGRRHPLEDVINEFRRYSGDIQIDLRASQEQTGRQFVDALLDSEPNAFDEHFRQVLFQHTSGQPLFTIELLRDLAQQGELMRDTGGRWMVGPHLDWAILPARVEGVIEQRIGRLEKDLQDTLSTAAVEGIRFTAEVVATVNQQEPRRTIAHLSGELDKRDRLVQAQGFERIGSRRASLYQFTQNLFQVYLYEAMDEIERSYLHESIGLALEELYGERSAEIAGQLARHFEEAGLVGKAIAYRLEAANQAIWSAAYQEASDHLKAGLDLLQIQPDLPANNRYEMQLQAALGPTLVALQGWGKPEAQQAYDRACELCQGLGDTQRFASILHGLATLHEFRGEFKRAEQLVNQRLELLKEHQSDSRSMLETYELLSCSTFHQGIFKESLKNVNFGLDHYHLITTPRSRPSFVGDDHGIACMTWQAFDLFFLGFPDQALTSMQEALDLTAQNTILYLRTTVLCRAAFLHIQRGELQAAFELTEQSNAMTSESSYPYFRASGLIMQGWVRAQRGQTDSIQEIRKGLAVHYKSGANMDRPFYLALLAEAQLVSGQVQDGLETIENAIELVREGRPFFYEAELYRLRGLIKLTLDSKGNQAEAEQDYEQALEVARRQSALSLELRAAASLARLWQAQGKSAEALALLQPVYDRFEEGFETRDLQEARNLLDELTGVKEEASRA